jgi:hypothetical protein
MCCWSVCRADSQFDSQSNQGLGWTWANVHGLFHAKNPSPWAHQFLYPRPNHSPSR